MNRDRLQLIRDQHDSQALCAKQTEAAWGPAGHHACHQNRAELLVMVDELLAELDAANDMLGRFANDSDAYRLGEERERAAALAIVDDVCREVAHDWPVGDVLCLVETRLRERGKAE